jgi:hypothetical protein
MPPPLTRTHHSQREKGLPILLPRAASCCGPLFIHTQHTEAHIEAGIFFCSLPLIDWLIDSPRHPKRKDHLPMPPLLTHSHTLSLHTQYAAYKRHHFQWIKPLHSISHCPFAAHKHTLMTLVCVCFLGDSSSSTRAKVWWGIRTAGEE